jgi:hypothetical protein
MRTAWHYGGQEGGAGVCVRACLRFELLDLLRRVAVVALLALARVARLSVVLVLGAGAGGHGVQVVAPGAAVVLGVGGVPRHPAVRGGAAHGEHPADHAAAGVVLREVYDAAFHSRSSGEKEAEKKPNRLGGVEPAGTQTRTRPRERAGEDENPVENGNCIPPPPPPPPDPPSNRLPKLMAPAARLPGLVAR